MLQRRRILPVAISGLLLTPVSPLSLAAKPVWECRATPDGQGWECYKAGERFPWGPPPPTPVLKAAETREPTKPKAPAEPEVMQPEAPQIAKPAAPAEAAEEPAAKAPAPAAEPKERPVVAEEAPAATALRLLTEQPGGVAEARLDRGLNWSQCAPPARAAPVKVRPKAAALALDQRIHARADSVEMLMEEEAVAFSGDVKVARGDQLVEAEEVHYNNIDDILEAEGNVYYQHPGIRLQGATARLELSASKGRVEEAEYRIPERMARGNATVAEMQSREQAQFEDISYTTCPPGNQDWVLQAEELDLDQATGVGRVRGASLAFKGVPFLYLPRASFPIDDRRKSGFLLPSVGHSSETGFDVSAPYYLNLAPNYDATVTPRIMSKRGLMLGGEFRYLAETHEGQVAAEFLPDDRERDSNDNETRGAFSYRGNGELAPRWTFDLDLNYVSDKDYLEDFGNSLSMSATRQLLRRGDLRYHGDYWSLLGRVEYFQTIDKLIAAVDKPYRRLPQLLVLAERPDGPLGLTYHLRGEYVHFDHDESVDGHRFDLNPAISLPMRNAWGYLTPKLGARYTGYRLHDEGAGNPDSPSRSSAIVSLDGGMVFERDANWFGSAMVQTLEPRLYYLWIPDEDQDDLPVFDSSERDFSFDNLFRENRFNGVDRLGDTHQLTLALTSRSLSAASGAEWLRASVGQILYFADRNVQLAGVGTQDDNSSAVVGELAARLTENWSARAAVEWDPHGGEHKTEHTALQLHYGDERRRIFNLAYRYNQGLVEQTDASARWPITPRLHGVARWNYSWMHSRTMEGLGGIEYESCCWVARAVARRHVNDVNENANTTLFFQLELKGLTSIGSDIEALLDRGILGYKTDR